MTYENKKNIIQPRINAVEIRGELIPELFWGEVVFPEKIPEGGAALS